MKNAIAAILLAATVVACGGGDEEPTTPSTSETPSETAAAELPECSEVWVDGKTIPADYEGCVRGGETVEANAKPCGDGPEEFVQYQYVEDEITYPFVAILGEKVIEYVDDENAPYAKLFDKCDGEPVN
jgi:hypothetical protein